MKGVKLGELGESHPLQAFGKDEQALVGHLDDFVDDRQSSHRVEVAGLGSIDAGFALRHHHDGLVLAQRINQLDRALPAYGQGQHGVRETTPYPAPAGWAESRFLLLLAWSGAQRAFFLPYFTLSVLCSSFDDIKARKDAGPTVYFESI